MYRKKQDLDLVGRIQLVLYYTLLCTSEYSRPRSYELTHWGIVVQIVDRMYKWMNS